MSFILDALRKSENERQREAAPTLTRANYAAPAKRQIPVWTWILIGLLSLALLVLGASIWSGSGQTPETTASSVPERNTAPAPATSPAPGAESVNSPAALPPDLSAPPRTIDELRARNPDLPEYRLEFVAFDSTSPESSSAWINGRRRYAGDNIGSGVTLAEVRQDSVLLTYEGEVFLLRL
jgi:hypothetical protein